MLHEGISTEAKMHHFVHEKVRKWAEYMLDMMILSPGSGRSYEILYCIYNDLKKYWMIRYEIRWFDKKGYHFRHRGLHITDKRVMEFYEC